MEEESNTLLEKFMEEQNKTGIYNLDGPIGKEYQEFVDYWVNVVCTKLGSKIKPSEEDSSESSEEDLSLSAVLFSFSILSGIYIFINLVYF